MSKLPPSLKALINAPFARPGPTPAPPGIRDVYERIARDAAARELGTRPWLAISTAATLTRNAPDALPVLHAVAASACGAGGHEAPLAQLAQLAELMREVGLKCVSFNGIPRTINCLVAFRAALPDGVVARLASAPSRTPTPRGLDGVASRGRRLWDSIYAPFGRKLVDKLARAHPDLPVHILGSHYGPLLSDPGPGPSAGADPAGGGSLARTGRVLTSLVAIACLRAQTGVGPQVLSHVFGLRKAFEDGACEDDGDGDGDGDGVRWLASDEGLEWVLRTVDGIVDGLDGYGYAGAKL
ncbi:uncharacterized protein UV8b_05930 [Ustilaginoidea virens]|uniref:Uncharacterized protein n=1 Tax=Ustilaginoidea virens TaxID=1159556 RepID=A0A8E5HUE0_USTVR|nr:uncharacterized protein UV8b_05930 [Ustilaginoidea virens]QUC21687.1 hypothetical protein UV8b_05930 [Ustilaginoidea virens]